MKSLAPRILLFLSIDIALLLLCAFSIPLLINRSQAPFALREFRGNAFISQILDSTACHNVHVGDRLILWAQTRASSADDIEFLAELSQVGEPVPLQVERNAQRLEASATLIRWYSLPYIVIVCFVGFVTWCLGVFVLLARPGNLAATTLHWALIAMAVVVVTAYEGTTPTNRLPILSSILFFVAYAGTAATFFLFTTIFPRTKRGSFRLKTTLVFLPALVFVVGMSYHHSRALMSASVAEFAAYSLWFRLFHVLLLAYVGAGIVSFVYSYVTAVTREERKKLKWILWGISIGPMPFLALGIIPREIGMVPPIPEEYSLLALVIIPCAFAISFVKHRVLDIEIVMSRTTAYTIVIGVLLAAYVVFVSAVASFIGNLTASAGAAIVVALLFEPLRVRVQHAVDKHFFRVQYDFRKAEQRFIDNIKQSLGVVQLGEVLVKETNDLIPVERVGFFTLHRPGNRLQLVAHRGFGQLEKHAPRFELEKLKSDLRLPVAIDEIMEPGIAHETADAEVFRRWGITLVYPLLSQESEILAFLALGSRRSGARFAMEDVDLVKNACTQAGLSIERITLQEKLFVEHVERERLRELSQLKSDFVSYVSHELKTPLTSIRMFAELLRTRPRKLDKKGMDYARIIEGESDRLDRMVTTILDSAKIDKGINIYDVRKIDLVDAVKAALAIMQYQLDKHGFHVGLSLRPLRKHNGIASNGTIPIRADTDAIVQAITNLLSNAIKYSGKRKVLRISALCRGDRALCRVQDKGVGIPPQVLPHLFEKFYRDPEYSDHVGGVGLGLPLVKHIMESHNGTVEVMSTPGKGSTFTLSFPIATQTKASQS